MMRNDICFPCMENPTRCFFLSVPESETATSHALGCNRLGRIRATPDRKRWEEWCLLPHPSDAGVVRILHASTGRVLVCDFSGTLTTLPWKRLEQKDDSGREEDSDGDDSSLWSLEDHDTKEGIVRIRSFAGNCYLCLDDPAAGYLSHDNTAAIVSTTQERGRGTLWKSKYVTGELCYLQLAHYGSNPKLLLCDNLGRLRFSRVFGGWEVWRFIEAGNNQIQISSWTHQSRLLSCNDYGVVQTTEDRWSDGTLWKVQKAPKGLDGVLIIHATTGRLLRSDGTTITTTGYMDGVATTWQFTAAHRQKYYVTNLGYDKRVSLIKGTTLKTTQYRRDCEVWSVEQTYQGTTLVLLKSEKFQRYLRYDVGRGLGVSEPNVEADVTCRWRIIESPSSKGVCFVSAMEPYLALSCNAKGQLQAVEHQGPYESWNLEPTMPDSLQQWQINLMIGGAVGAALLGPALAVGMMATAGAAEGVAAAGATVVAAEAAVTTTAVAGEVAVATGTAATLGMAGITAAIGTGAAVGLSATGILLATSQRGRGEGTDLKATEQDRPFCEWKNWFSAVI